MPDDDALSAFITASPTPPKLREIAKAFGISPQQRAELRARLHRLATDNTAALVNEASKSPAISLLQVISIDHDGYAQNMVQSGHVSNGLHRHLDALRENALLFLLLLPANQQLC